MPPRLSGQGRHPPHAHRRGDEGRRRLTPRKVIAGTFQGFVRGDDLPPRLLSDPSSALEGPGVRVLRSKKNTVVEIEGVPGWIVRRYRPRGLHSVVRNSVMVSKERNAWEFALEYERRGVPTAPVVALLERFENGLFRESLLVTRKVPSRLLKDRILECDARDAGTKNPFGGRRAWLRAFARFVKRAHAAGVYHCDLNAANVLVPLEHEEPSENAFVLIDVNRTRFGLPDDPRLVAADLSRIGGTPDERKFVLRCYADDGEEYVRLRDAVLRRRTLHDVRKRLNRRLGVKRALVALKLK